MLLGELILVWVGGALVVGFLGFFAVVLATVGRAFARIWRTFTGLGASGGTTLGRPATDLVACPRPRCGYLNRGEARYCAQCGAPLDAE